MKSFEDVCAFLNDTKEQIKELENTIIKSENYLKHGNASEVARFKARGIELDKTKAAHESEHKQCTHLKGGTVFHSDGKQIVWKTPYSSGGDAKKPWNGEDEEIDRYAVIKHRFAWGDTWVICLRCGKKWKPGDPEYDVALKFPTSNTDSSAMCVAGLNITEARELTKES